MNIEILSSHGTGKTENASFDNALSDINMHDYNLVSLSSVIPEGATIEQNERHNLRYPIGSVVACVMARNTSNKQGKSVCAGLGWCKSESGGVFVEETSASREECSTIIDESLRGCKSNRGDREWNSSGKKIEASKVGEDYTTVVVLALYGGIEINSRP